MQVVRSFRWTLGVLSFGLACSIALTAIGGTRPSTRPVTYDPAPAAAPKPAEVIDEPAPIPPPPPRFRTFGDFASGRDSHGIAAQLDTMGANPDSDLLGVLDELTRIPPGQVDSALAQLSPAVYDGDTDAALSAGRRHMDMVSGFLDDSTAQENDGRWSPWIGGLNGTDDGRGDSVSKTHGGAGGADYRFGRNIRFGFQFGYSHSDVTRPDSSTEGKIDIWNYGTYALWQPAYGYIEAIVNLSDQSYDDQREISFGQINRLATSSHDGRGKTAYLGAGLDRTILGFRVRPTAAMEYGRLHQDSFTEDGADSLNLWVDSRDEDSLRSQLGMRFDYDLPFLLAQVTPRARINWGHEFVTDPRDLEAQFAQSGTEPFTVHGEAGNADGLDVSGGLAVKVFGVSAFVDYDVTYSAGNDVGHAVTAGLWTVF